MRPRLLCAVLATLGLGLVVVPEASAATGGNNNTYTVSAEGDGLQVTVTDPSLPVVQTVAASPYGAASNIDSIGDSSAGAGAPYSPLAYTLPGTVDGLGAGFLPPIPPLPGEVTASYPTQPKSSANQGPYSLTATSTQYAAKADANLGVEPTGANASTFSASASSQAQPDGSVDAQASAGADLVDLGGLIDIGNVSSKTEMTEQASQKPKISTSADLGTVTLVGKVTGLTGIGLQLLGIEIPLNITPALLTPLNSALSSAGIHIDYIPAEYVYTDGSTGSGSPDAAKTVESVDSGALQISASQFVKSQGLVTVTYTLGRTYLSATDTPGVQFSQPVGATPSSTQPASPSSAPSPPPVAPNTGSSPAIALPGSAVSPGPATAQGMPPGLANATHPSGPIAPTNGGYQPNLQSRPTPQSRPPVVASLAEFGIGHGEAERLYLILVAGALAALAMSLLARFLAVRLHLSDEPRSE